MTFDLPGGRRLVLAGGEFGAFWLAAGAAAVVLLWVLYREERKLVSRRTGLGLLGLRLVAAVALVGALFEPIAARTYREAVRGRVVVAVDVSESMATADPGRTDAERAGLRKVLGMSPAEPIDAMSRREVARRLLVGPGAPLARVAAGHDVSAFAFARDVAGASLPALGEILSRPGTPDDPASRATDWQPALAEALKAGASAAPVIGVVLVTDGRRNAASDAGPTVDRLAARGVPVFPVLVGSTRPPRDAAIAAIRAPESVYKGDVATVEATLKLDGYAGREVSVTLDRPGASPIRRTVLAPGDGTRPTVTFRVPLEETGAVPLVVALDPQEGDSRPDNDRRAVTIEVADDKARVLLIDGEARWEFRYLRNALARDPRVAVESVVFHQPRPGLSAVETYTYGHALPPRGDGAGPDPLGGFDAIVIGDVDPADATAEVWARLEAYVAERGGTLVIAPGPRSWSALGSVEASRRLLPVLDPTLAAVADDSDDPAHPGLPPGVALEPTEAAASDAGSWPMLQLANDAEESRRRWAGLPRLPWALVARVKPGAIALAATGDDPTAIVMAAQPYGLGKVLWVGADGTWRWRLRVGDAYHHRFWGQVVRWASAGKLAAGNAFVRFGAVKPRVGEGEPVRIQARIAEGVAGVGADPLIAARVFKAGRKPGEAVAVVPLRPAPGQPRLFEGVAPTLPQGSYSLRLDAPSLADALHLTPAPPVPAPSAALEIVPRDSSERIELGADRDPLDRLASATGGTVVPDFKADILPTLLHALVKQTTRVEETPLWDTPAALILFFAIITVEWVLRKRAGLP